MSCSMGDYLKVVSPFLDSNLVSSSALAQIQNLIQHLPLSSLAGLECRLGAEQSDVDFLVNFPCSIPNFPDRFLTHPVWQKSIEFCREWTDTRSFLHQMVEHIWLEFDLDKYDRSPIPIPCIFLGLNRNSIGKVFSLRELANVWPLSNSSNLVSNLQLCADVLPEKAWIAHLGVMLSRPTQVVRVVVKGIRPDRVLDYLTKIGSIGTDCLLSDLISTLSELVDSMVLDLDVGDDTIHSKIGLECFLSKQPAREPRWQLFLDYLVKADLCTPSKRNALLAWPGGSQKADCPEIWPNHLTLGDLLVGSKALSIIYRTINHIKLIYEPDSPLSAKAYLAFGHIWVPHSTLQFKNSNANRVNELSVKETLDEVTQYRERVRSYYDRMTPTILKYVGKTYQSGLLKSEVVNNDPYRWTNLYCAERAGIKPGNRLLDAGCGVCGPSIDIAQSIERVKIDAITLSAIQVKIARELVQRWGLTDRIEVHQGDFHALPFAGNVFDVVFFLEAAGYSGDCQRLFKEVYRVLRPGGKLYIKEPFIKELPLSKLEREELEQFNQVYVYQATRMSEMSASIVAAGFEQIISHDLTDRISIQKFNQAMFNFKDKLISLTEFGQHHYRDSQSLPIVFGEIQAYKPL